MEVTKQFFGELEGKQIDKFIIKNDHGFEVSCINYGCIITEIIAPDKDGELENVVLGFDNIEDYVERSPNFGAVIGRVAGRIRDAEFELDGKKYLLARNNNQNHLHGGLQGFAKVIWDAKVIEGESDASIEFSYFSPDGDQGYPGNLNVSVIYRVNNENELDIIYSAKSDERTLLNMTNHSYFNLTGNLKKNILDHTLILNSDKFVELREDLIPTGNILQVENTPFDFRNGKKVKEGTVSNHTQNKIASGGYDHPFLLNKQEEKEIMVWDEESGRSLTIETDELAVVLYTSNQMGGDLVLQEGRNSEKFLGLCLETQGLPDFTHHEHFPSKILEANQPYSSKTKYIFGIK